MTFPWLPSPAEQASHTPFISTTTFLHFPSLTHQPSLRSPTSHPHSDPHFTSSTQRHLATRHPYSKPHLNPSHPNTNPHPPNSSTPPLPSATKQPSLLHLSLVHSVFWLLDTLQKQQTFSLYLWKKLSYICTIYRAIVEGVTSKKSFWVQNIDAGRGADRIYWAQLRKDIEVKRGRRLFKVLSTRMYIWIKKIYIVCQNNGDLFISWQQIWKWMILATTNTPSSLPVTIPYSLSIIPHLPLNIYWLSPTHHPHPDAPTPPSLKTCLSDLYTFKNITFQDNLPSTIHKQHTHTPAHTHHTYTQNTYQPPSIPS